VAPSAPWAARFGHTSVIDADGNIYVIGGCDGTTCYSDVWRSTDRGDVLHRCGRTMHAHLAMRGRVHQCVREASAPSGIDE
jgi:hypothetical protein